MGQRGALLGERLETIDAQPVPASLLERAVDGRVEALGGHVAAGCTEEQRRILQRPRIAVVPARCRSAIRNQFSCPARSATRRARDAAASAASRSPRSASDWP